MDMDIATPHKRGLKTRHYNKDMNKDIATLPKKGLKTRPYNIGMEKRDLKKYDCNIYIYIYIYIYGYGEEISQETY